MNTAAVRAYAIKAAEQEVASSRARMGEAAWTAHGDWVESHIVECARLWILEQVTGRPH